MTVRKLCLCSLSRDGGRSKNLRWQIVMRRAGTAPSVPPSLLSEKLSSLFLIICTVSENATEIFYLSSPKTRVFIKGSCLVQAVRKAKQAVGSKCKAKAHCDGGRRRVSLVPTSCLSQGVHV